MGEGGGGGEKRIWAIGGGIGDFMGFTFLALWGESRQGPRFVISQHWEILGILLPFEKRFSIFDCKA